MLDSIAIVSLVMMLVLQFVNYFDVPKNVIYHTTMFIFIMFAKEFARAYSDHTEDLAEVLERNTRALEKKQE
jgi:hypothetical protein